MRTRLKPEIVVRVGEDKHLRAMITGTLCVTAPTMKKYLDENHIVLTSIDCLNLIMQHFGMALNDIIQGGQLFNLPT